VRPFTKSAVDSSMREPRILQYGRQETVVTTAVEEVLVDDGLFEKAQPARGNDVFGFERAKRLVVLRMLLFAASNHFLAHYSRARAGAGDEVVVEIGVAESLLDGRVAHHFHEPPLVAAGDVYEVGAAQRVKARLGRRGVVAEVQPMDVLDALLDERLASRFGRRLGLGTGHRENDAVAGAVLQARLLDHAGDHALRAAPTAYDEELARHAVVL
jgi:hypothetical protein